MSVDYKSYIISYEWKARAKAALERAGNKCQVCSWTAKLRVHHNTYERLGNEADTDLCVLCKHCHGLFHRIKDGKPTRQPNKSTDHKRKHVKLSRKELNRIGAVKSQLRKVNHLKAIAAERQSWSADKSMTQCYGLTPATIIVGHDRHILHDPVDNSE